MFIKDNQAGEEVTQIDYLCVIGSPISVTNMNEFKRVRWNLRTHLYPKTKQSLKTIKIPRFGIVTRATEIHFYRTNRATALLFVL